MGFAITAGAALTAEGVLSNPVVLVEDGHIRAVADRASLEIPAGWQIHDFPGALLSPAFCDVHIHGSAGHDVMDDSRAGETAMAKFLAARGVSRFLPTTVTAQPDSTLRALERIADWIERVPDPGLACPVGIHLEGPFISAGHRGVQPAEFITAPDIALFDRFQAAARGHIRLMTLAVEQPGGTDLLRHAVSQGVRVSLGHSGAVAAQATAAVNAGATSATHTFNAMRPMEHREPGLAGTVLSDDRLYAELVADGHHVAPAVVRIWARSKPPGRRILVTDAISATGCGDGKFRLGPLMVTVIGERCDYEGKLAGSVLTLDRAVQNLLVFAGISLDEAAAAASCNPAAMLGLPPLDIAEAAPASLVVFAPTGERIAAWIDGLAA